jgi:hypothetical protein
VVWSSFLLALLTPIYTDAAVALSNEVQCDTLEAEDGSSFDVCYLYSSQTPSPAQFENGTTVYMGPYVNTYDVLEGVTDGEQVNNTDDSLLFTIEVGRDSQSNECYVSISPIQTYGQCTSCVYCGDDKYTADCTNLPNGRNVTCEASLYAESPIFFPLTKEAMSTSDENDTPPVEPPLDDAEADSQAPGNDSSNAVDQFKGMAVAGFFLLGTFMTVN